jgi:hypothetical protein
MHRPNQARRSRVDFDSISVWPYQSVAIKAKEDVMPKVGGKSVIATLNPTNQNLDGLHRIVSKILDLAGCGGCGRLAYLNLGFQGDPAELTKEGVISIQTEGF